VVGSRGDDSASCREVTLYFFVVVNVDVIVNVPVIRRSSGRRQDVHDHVYVYGGERGKR